MPESGTGTTVSVEVQRENDPHTIDPATFEQHQRREPEKRARLSPPLTPAIMHEETEALAIGEIVAQTVSSTGCGKWARPRCPGHGEPVRECIVAKEGPNKVLVRT